MLCFQNNGKRVREFGLFHRNGYKFDLNEIRKRLCINDKEQIIQREFKNETQMCDVFI